MIYVMSDLHGCYEKYMEMLCKIKFKDEDILYVLGDVTDRGDKGIKILLDMMSRSNVFPILGNHDYMAYSVLKRFNSEVNEENIFAFLKGRTFEMYQDWMFNGGDTTVKEFTALDNEMRQAVLEYFGEFELYAEVEAGGRTFLLVHGGLGEYEPEKDVENCSIDDLIWSRCEYDKQYYKNKYLVTGHTPTKLIDAACDGTIYKNKNNIAIDCGAVFGLKLGCICLDTMEEFYV